MCSIGILFLLVSGVLTLTLPRTYALIPLLLAAAYTPASEALDIAGATFTIARLLVSVAFVRIALRSEGLGGRWTGIDSLVLLWGAVLMMTSAFHTNDAWMFRLGVVWTELGSYFIVRCLVRTRDDVRRIIGVLVPLLLPLALFMAIEKSTGTNPFSVFDSVSAQTQIREGSVRATGPFSHPILAGTVGSVLIGLSCTFWKESKLYMLVGCIAGAAIVVSSASSGPLLMTAAIVFGYLLLPLRRSMRAIQILGLLCIAALSLAMNDPVYFLMAKIDLVGGSQGYFRAQLIRSAIDHLGEWWVAGTDYTRHWMPTGLKVTGRHTDMTNHVLWMGVLGGLPLMLAFLAILARSFFAVGRFISTEVEVPAQDILTTWGLGCVLFGLTVNFMSITMFDQSAVFFWLTVALIASATRVEAPLVVGGVRSRPAQERAPAFVQFD